MKKRRRLNFWQMSQLIPPIAARLLAGRLDDQQIASGSGLTLDEVFLMSHMTSWAGIDIIRMRKFLEGCRVNLCNHTQAKRAKNYILRLINPKRRTNWRFLRRHPEWESKYKPLLLRYQRSLATM